MKEKNAQGAGAGDNGQAVLVLKAGAAYTSKTGTNHDNLFGITGIEDVLDENGEPKIAVRIRVHVVEGGECALTVAGGSLPSWFSGAHRAAAITAVCG